jgi:hypothetical protein
MRFRKNPMTPLAAVIADLLAGGRWDRMPGPGATPSTRLGEATPQHRKSAGAAAGQAPFGPADRRQPGDHG